MTEASAVDDESNSRQKHCQRAKACLAHNSLGYRTQLAMSKKRIRESRNGVTLTKRVFYDGTPRKPVGVHYIVTSPRNIEGRKFDTLAAAQKYFNVQVSLRPKK